MLIKWLPKPFSNQKRLRMKVKIELWMSFALADLQVTSHFFGKQSKFPPFSKIGYTGIQLVLTRTIGNQRRLKINLDVVDGTCFLCRKRLNEGDLGETVKIGIAHLCVRTISQQLTEGGRAFSFSFYLLPGSRVGGVGFGEIRS